MIDKNDVKMPVQREGTKIDLSDKDMEMRIVDLLDKVNEVESKLELRLDNSYYSRFNWFGGNRSDKSYFSYQEEAVYDFIFNLNKSGILSDQVGMGKTIEAGMVVSELASRKELKSLLIIVPNEIMAQKWKSELEDKFGIKEYPGRTKVYPGVETIQSYNDFCRCIYNCIKKDSFHVFSKYIDETFTKENFPHTYTPSGANETLKEVIARFIAEDIPQAVYRINRDCRRNEYGQELQVNFTGDKFEIVGTDRSRPYVYDESGEIARYISQRGSQVQRPGEVVNSTFFPRKYKELLLKELDGLFLLLGDYFATQPNIIAAVAKLLTQDYPILVIPISYTEKVGDKYCTREFLNRVLATDPNDFKHKFFENGKDVLSCEDYRIVDFFIDVGYQTLIVDEVHDYINVEAKKKRSDFLHSYESNFLQQNKPKSGSDEQVSEFRKVYYSNEYDMYELFDDFYFIPKSSLYRKLKRLADKADRKIFLTATPIKSDMVDFYLLTLIASNKDADAYTMLSKEMETAFDTPRLGRDKKPIPYDEKLSPEERREYDIEQLCRALSEEGIKNAANEYHSRRDRYEREEEGSTVTNRKYMYPYFTKFVRDNSHSVDNLCRYLRVQLDYMSAEEIFMELLLAYRAERKTTGGEQVNLRDDINVLTEGLRVSYEDLPEPPLTREMLTRVVFKALLNNTVRMRFEDDFTTEQGSIKRISDLLKLKDGPRRWFKTYRKYGIRHTRHQTYNLSKCDELQKLNKDKIERYKNLPVWPKRNGSVIYLYRDDCFFDSFINVRRDLNLPQAQAELTLEDLPNYDTLVGSEEEKQERFETAGSIFGYINESMSGGQAGSHEPITSNYESVDILDSNMVDYKLALVNKLMTGSDKTLGAISKKVLLFAENDRDAIIEWFKYQKCAPIWSGEELDGKKLAEYRKKWASYGIDQNLKSIRENWSVSDTLANGALSADGNLLVIIDPKRYEKGVDLQKADTIINFDINYDPLKMEQRIGRIDRIRPAGKTPEINIISFVALNDMSGFVINFFANELKMFTQWMGETTGIVSVDDTEADGSKQEVARGVSFESNVEHLDKMYKCLYEVCMGKKDLPDSVLQDYAELLSKSLKTDYELTLTDLRYLYELRKPFDDVFRNSISPQRNGYEVRDSDARVMRFNSSNGVFEPCSAADCSKCSNKEQCNMSDNRRMWNDYETFRQGIRSFFETGKKVCSREVSDYNTRKNARSIQQVDGGQDSFSDELSNRQRELESTRKSVDKLLKELPEGKQCFTLPFDKFSAIFAPIKKLYWDDVACKYVNKILQTFYKQCDNVLDSAKLFERFIKTLSIAEFMNNMEGTV